MNFLKQQFNLSFKFWFITFLTCTILWISNSYTNGGFLNLIIALSGVIYAFFAGKGKVICFAFGFIYNFTYAFVSYEYKLYGDMILNLCFYIPIGIWGVYSWLKNKKEDKIIIRYLSKLQRIFYILITAIATLICAKFLNWMQTSYVYAESFILVASVISFFLQVNRYVENYFLISLVNIVSIGVWFCIFDTKPENLVVLLTTIIFFIIGVYYLFLWNKEAIKK